MGTSHFYEFCSRFPHLCLLLVSKSFPPRIHEEAPGSHLRGEELSKCVFRGMRQSDLWSITWSNIWYWWHWLRWICCSGQHVTITYKQQHPQTYNSVLRVIKSIILITHCWVTGGTYRTSLMRKIFMTLPAVILQKQKPYVYLYLNVCICAQGTADKLSW